MEPFPDRTGDRRIEKAHRGGGGRRQAFDGPIICNPGGPSEHIVSRLTPCPPALRGGDGAARPPRAQNHGGRRRLRGPFRTAGRRSLRRLRRGLLARAQRGEQLLAPRRRLLGRLGLDHAEAADLERQLGQRHGRVHVARREACDLLHVGLVPSDQRALHAPVRTVAERIQGRAAQALHARERGPPLLDPLPERALPRAALGVLAGEHRGREVVGELEIALELGLGPPPRLRVEPRDLVLVLVGQ